MKALKEQLAFYSSYHRNPYNILMHFLGIPTIVFSILLFLSIFQLSYLSYIFNLSTLFALAVLIYYFLLDIYLPLFVIIWITPLFLLIRTLHQFELPLIFISIVLFVIGWVLQIIGHSVFEKNKPAFLDNLLQLLIGPLFITVEALRKIGIRRY